MLIGAHPFILLFDFPVDPADRVPHAFHSAILKGLRYRVVEGGRNTLGSPMRQLPKRWTATAQNPCSKRFPSCARRSSPNNEKNPMPAGLALRSPRGRARGSGAALE